MAEVAGVSEVPTSATSPSRSLATAGPPRCGAQRVAGKCGRRRARSSPVRRVDGSVQRSAPMPPALSSPGLRHQSSDANITTAGPGPSLRSVLIVDPLLHLGYRVAGRSLASRTVTSAIQGCLPRQGPGACADPSCCRGPRSGGTRPGARPFAVRRPWGRGLWRRSVVGEAERADPGLTSRWLRGSFTVPHHGWEAWARLQVLQEVRPVGRRTPVGSGCQEPAEC